MKEMIFEEVQEVNGGISTGAALGVAGAWVGTVAGVGLAVVGAPVLAGAAVGLGFALALNAAISAVS